MVLVCHNGLEMWTARNTYAREPMADMEDSEEAPLLSSNPRWLRLRGVLVDALRPFPDAWRAVLAVISTEDKTTEDSS